MKPAPDLFEQEASALERALAARDDPALPAAQYRAALSDLVGHFERLMRESRRLIRRSDREERELNVLNDELHRLAAQLEYKARHDSLTGALNRGAIFERASLHLQRGALSLVVLDIDFFKSINDAFGHPAGDAVICEVVNRLSAGCRRRWWRGRPRSAGSAARSSRSCCPVWTSSSRCSRPRRCGGRLPAARSTACRAGS